MTPNPPPLHKLSRSLGQSAPTASHRSSIGVLGRAARAAGLLLLVWAGAGTLSGLLPATTPASGAALAQAGPDGPLADGWWESVANGDRITRLLRQEDVLWAATDAGGLMRWDLNGDTHRQFLAPQHGLLSNVISDLELTPDGILWLATDRALTRFDTDTFEVQNIVPDPALEPGTDGRMPSRRVTALEARPDGSLWVGFSEEWVPTASHPRRDEPGAFSKGGMAIYRPSDGTWSQEIHVQVSGSGTDATYQTIPSENITDIEYGSDGLLWIGTRPYYTFEVQCFDATDCVEAWVQDGGGSAGTNIDQVDDPATAEWIVYRPGRDASSSSCLSNHISQLQSDVEGRMWVATNDKGLYLLQSGLRKVGCKAGIPYYRRAITGGSDAFRTGGLRGGHIFSIGIDPLGRVWIGHGSDRTRGEGIAILDHKNTFEDSSASLTPWVSDDEWQYIGFDGEGPKRTDVLISALAVSDLNAIYLGTRDDRLGDGFGIRRYNPSTLRWDRLVHGDDGLPSNQITGIAAKPGGDEVWFAMASRGVARRAADGWSWWRAFGTGEIVTTATEHTAAGFGRIAVPLADKAEYDALFPSGTFVLIGDDPTRYRVIRYRLPVAGRGPWIDITPDLVRAVPEGTAIYRIERGPASDEASQITFGLDGDVYAGGRESVWLPDRECASPPECWLDGGLSRYDGTGWDVWSQVGDIPDGRGVPDQMVSAVETDLAGRIWVGTGKQSESEGDGIAVFDPETDTFVAYHIIPALSIGTGPKIGSNAVSDFSIDPDTGHVWVSHFPAKKVNESIAGTLSEIFFGGGVSRWNGTEWQFWRKDTGAAFRGYGAGKGTFNTVLADRVNDLVWLGGWDASPKRFHWGEGYGVHAALNWCPIDACTNEAWQHVLWEEQGEVTSLALDHEGRVWAGVARRGLGFIPPEAGVRVLEGGAWHVYTPENSGLVDNEISVLAAESDAMWVGSLDRGVSLFLPMAPATPTPVASRTPTRTNTPEPTPDVTTPGPGSPTAPPTVTTGPGTVVPTKVPSACVGRFVGWCDVYLPFTSSTASWCNRRPCLPAPSEPTPIRVIASPTPIGAPTSAPSTSVPPPTTVPPTTVIPPTTVVPPGTVAPPTNTAPSTAQPTNTVGPTASGPSATPTATPTASPTASATSTPTATSVVVPTSAPIRIGAWENINAGRSLTREDMRAVHGISWDQIIMVGSQSAVLIWDGFEMTSGSAPGGRMFNDVFMLDSRNGFIVGDKVGTNSTLLRTRNGGASWSVSGASHVDDWGAVTVFKGAAGNRGWVVGKDRGSRLFFDGSEWKSRGGGDVNTGHEYSGVAMINENSAVAIQSKTSGARMYSWNGADWSPGPVTGQLFDIDIKGPGLGIAVGPNGFVWRMNAAGEWSRAADRIPSSGRDVLAVTIVSENLMWAAGARGGLWYWNGLDWNTVTVSRVNTDLHGIWVAPDGSTGFAVGDGGAILRYTLPE